MDENMDNIQNTIVFLYNVSKFLICYNYSKIKFYVLDYIEDFSSEYKKNVTNITDDNLSTDKQTEQTEQTKEGEELIGSSNKKDN